MNRTKIEWCDYSWNPATGCLHGCPYCYARKIAERFRGSKAWPRGFEPRFRPERLIEPALTKHPQTILVCSMADLFGEWVPQEWIHRIFLSCQEAPWHTYLFLTKNPARYESLSVHSCFEQFMNSKNTWFGTTITGIEVVDRLGHLQASDLPNIFISFEPLLADPGPLDLTGIRQVVIEAQTNPERIPPYHAIQDIVHAARDVGAKVFVKDNLERRLRGNPLFARELCWSVRK